MAAFGNAMHMHNERNWSCLWRKLFINNIVHITETIPCVDMQCLCFINA